jgi:hypothetical protein
VHTRRLNYRTDKSYQQTILTAYRRNFHHLFEFSDILPIFAMNLSSWNSYIYLSPAVGAQWWGFTIAFLLYLSYRPASSFLVVWGIFVLIKLRKVKVINPRKAH